MTFVCLFVKILIGAQYLEANMKIKNFMASSFHPASHDAPSSSYLYCGANPGGSGPVSTVYKTGVVK